jgi:NCAIR mutase (PurE)-related protein
MFKSLYWKIREWIEGIVWVPAKCPEEVRDAVECAQNRRGLHLITDEEYAELFKATSAITEKGQAEKYFNGVNERFVLSAGATHLYDGSFDRCGLSGMRSSYLL